MITSSSLWLIWELAGAEWIGMFSQGPGMGYWRGDGGAYGYYDSSVDTWRIGRGNHEYRG